MCNTRNFEHAAYRERLADQCQRDRRRAAGQPQRDQPRSALSHHPGSTVILLRYRSGLSLRAVADALGRAPSTVAETEQAGLRRLARYFAERHPEEPPPVVQGAVKSALFRGKNTRAREDRKKAPASRRNPDDRPMSVTGDVRPGQPDR